MKKVLVFFLLVMVAASTRAQRNETLKIMWPQEYKWKVGSNQNTATQQLVEIIPSNETLQKWTIMGTMLVLKQKQIGQISQVPNMLYSRMQANAPKASLRVIEKGVNNGYNWILFKIQSPSFKSGPRPESQLYYAIQGKSALFINFVAVKQPALSVLFTEKWVKIFKASKLVIQ